MTQPLSPGRNPGPGEAIVCTKSRVGVGPGLEAVAPRPGLLTPPNAVPNMTPSLTPQDLPFLGSWPSRNNGFHVDTAIEHACVNATLENTMKDSPS